MDEDDLTVVPEPEYDVDVEETVRELAAERGIDITCKEYQQTILHASTRRHAGAGTYDKFMFEMPADKVTTQDALEAEINEYLDAMEEQMEGSR